MRVIQVQLLDKDKVEASWTIKVGRGSITRFGLDGCPHTGIDQVFEWIVYRLVRML